MMLLNLKLTVDGWAMDCWQIRQVNLHTNDNLLIFTKTIRTTNPNENTQMERYDYDINNLQGFKWGLESSPGITKKEMQAWCRDKRGHVKKET